MHRSSRNRQMSRNSPERRPVAGDSPPWRCNASTTSRILAFASRPFAFVRDIAADVSPHAVQPRQSLVVRAEGVVRLPSAVRPRASEAFRLPTLASFIRPAATIARLLAVLGLLGDHPAVDGRFHMHSPPNIGRLKSKCPRRVRVRLIRAALLGRGQDHRAIDAGVVVEGVPRGVDESPPELAVRPLDGFVQCLFFGFPLARSPVPRPSAPLGQVTRSRPLRRPRPPANLSIAS